MFMITFRLHISVIKNSAAVNIIVYYLVNKYTYILLYQYTGTQMCISLAKNSLLSPKFLYSQLSK